MVAGIALKVPNESSLNSVRLTWYSTEVRMSLEYINESAGHSAQGPPQYGL